ncbi:hypothetical protein B0H11DRAFT_1905207 [Mycena galericulata]|nr:hypothetical protein B0H11DRAFT_1905207 [Mycena galericulata]
MCQHIKLTVWGACCTRGSSDRSHCHTKSRWKFELTPGTVKMAVDLCKIICALRYLHHGLDGISLARRTHPGRLITYSKRSRHRHMLDSEKAKDDKRVEIRGIQTFFHHIRAISHLAGHDVHQSGGHRSKQHRTRVPALTSMCLFVLGRTLATIGDYSDVELGEIYDVVPAHHRQIALLFHGSYLIASRIPPHPGVLKAILDGLETGRLAEQTKSLVMLIVFRNSSYIDTSHVFSQLLLEALDGEVVPTSGQLREKMGDSISGSAADAMADIILDLMVLLEIDGYRIQDKFRRHQNRGLRHLLKQPVFYVGNREKPQGRILPVICSSQICSSIQPGDAEDRTNDAGNIGQGVVSGQTRTRLAWRKSEKKYLNYSRFEKRIQPLSLSSVKNHKFPELVRIIGVPALEEELKNK